MTKLMQAGTDAFSGSLPWLQPVGMRENVVPATENLCLDFGMDVIRANQFHLVLVNPSEKLAALLRGELQHGLFQLFHAHAGNFTAGGGFCEGKVHSLERAKTYSFFPVSFS